MTQYSNLENDNGPGTFREAIVQKSPDFFSQKGGGASTGFHIFYSEMLGLKSNPLSNNPFFKDSLIKGKYFYYLRGSLHQYS